MNPSVLLSTPQVTHQSLVLVYLIDKGHQHRATNSRGPIIGPTAINAPMLTGFLALTTTLLMTPCMWCHRILQRNWSQGTRAHIFVRSPKMRPTLHQHTKRWRRQLQNTAQLYSVINYILTLEMEQNNTVNLRFYWKSCSFYESLSMSVYIFYSQIKESSKS